MNSAQAQVSRVSVLGVLMAMLLLVARAPVARVGRAALAEPLRAFVIGLAAEIFFLPVLVAASIGLALTIALGILFTSIQAYEYSHILHHKYFFNEEAVNSGLYGSSFFMATGFHGFHVLIGTIFLIVCLGRLMAGGFTQEKHFGFEAAAWYWHFVDVVWLFLFAFIYVTFG